MSAIHIVLFTLALSLCIIICVYAIALFWVKRLRKEAAQALRDEVGDEGVFDVADCNFLGTLSSGYAQVRGNGLLALTVDGLHFRMFRPRRYLSIPLESIRLISHPRWFLGKTKLQELLRVDFVNPDGDEDACAWLVNDPQWWAEAITALRDGRQPPPRPRRR
jgi:hypothetical protein